MECLPSIGSVENADEEQKIFALHTTFRVNVHKLGKKGGSGVQLKLVEFMHDHNHRGPLPFKTDVPIEHDVVLLKTVNDQELDEKSAARPAPPHPPNFSILGINGDPRPVSLDVVKAYPPAIDQGALDAAVKDLVPDYISLSSGTGFTADIVEQTIQRSDSNDSPLICYRISTTPGLSGSPICSENGNGVFGLWNPSQS
jgi:hypothetical protein